MGFGEAKKYVMMNGGKILIRALTRFRAIFGSFVVLCVSTAWGVTVTSLSLQKQNNGIPNDQKSETSKNSDEEIRKLIEILRKRQESPEVIFAAINTLGDMKVKEAIPELIKYLDYERVYHYNKQPEYVGGVKIDGTEIRRTIPISGRYPATGSLVNIGKPALPALVRVIEEETTTLTSQNALYAIQQIFDGPQPNAVVYLENAMRKSKNPRSRRRLQHAAQETKAKWDEYNKKYNDR